MTQIIKYPSRTRDANGSIVRGGYVVFTHADATTGDILMVSTSLGRPAKHVVIEATSALRVRLNTQYTLYPARTPEAGFADPWTNWSFLASGVNYDTSAFADEVQLAAGETLEFDDDLPINDIYLSSGASNFSVLVI